MKLAVFSHAEHFYENGAYFAYAPYVREMNIWFKNVKEISIVAPLKLSRNNIDSPYFRKDIELDPVPSLDFTSSYKAIKSICKIPGIILKIYRSMHQADHLHLRCPGNIGLLACFIQIFFPSKPKTIKYAGNWDPGSKQPYTYSLQKRILSNEFFTRNAKVLVYGKWASSSKNIIPFFTFSYSVTDIKKINKDFVAPFKFIFVGNLNPGKRPLLAVQILESLKDKGYEVSLDIYGSGVMFQEISDYIAGSELSENINLHGAREARIIKEAYLNSHFSILPSVSEGWPKALAEAMFFGCIPVSTPISCVPWMLENGKRGVLIEPNLCLAVDKISEMLQDPSKLKSMSEQAQKWSQKYTLEKFSLKIKKML